MSGRQDVLTTLNGLRHFISVPPVKDLRLNKIAFNPEDLQKVLVYPLKNMSPPPEKYGSTPLREYGSTSEKYGSYPLKNNYGSTP